MARLRRGPASAVAAFCSFLVIWPGLLAWAADGPTTTLLYEQPVLTIDPGMHTAAITSAAVDRAGQVAGTGSRDKTVRVWSLADGQLLRTIRVPAGPGNIGKIYAVALSPDGTLIAAGGYTQGDWEYPIYLFDRSTGEMRKRITGLPQVTLRLVFSADGRYLVAGLGGDHGLRVYDRDRDWTEVFRDADYGGHVRGGLCQGWPAGYGELGWQGSAL